MYIFRSFGFYTFIFWFFFYKPQQFFMYSRLTIDIDDKKRKLSAHWD